MDQSVAHFCGTDISGRKFSSVDSQDSLDQSDEADKIMSQAMREANYWPAGQLFHVYFIKPEIKFDFFENFAHIFKEALNEWSKSSSINFIIKDSFKTRSYTESFVNLNILFEYSHSAYTVGFGQELYKPQSEKEHNVAFGT